MKTAVAVKLLMFILALILLSELSVYPAYAWGPNTHITMTKQALFRAVNTSLIIQQINSYPDAFYCGLLFPDISVLYYYTEFESYQATHSWLFYRRLLEEATTVEEKVFAYGVAIHLIQDSVAHNEWVPMKIRQTFGSNFYTHPLVEAGVENLYFDLTTSGALEYVDRFLPLANKVLGRDVTSIAYTFRDILRAGAFYSEAYAPPDVPFWNLYEAGAKVASGIYGVGDHKDYLEKAVELTINFLERGETPASDPTGVTKLTEATNNSNLYRFIFTFSTALTMATALSYLKRRKLRRR